jgi:hypothetical protein
LREDHRRGREEDENERGKHGTAEGPYPLPDGGGAHLAASGGRGSSTELLAAVGRRQSCFLQTPPQVFCYLHQEQNQQRGNKEKKKILQIGPWPFEFSENKLKLAPFIKYSFCINILRDFLVSEKYNKNTERFLILKESSPYFHFEFLNSFWKI